MPCSLFGSVALALTLALASPVARAQTDAAYKMLALVLQDHPSVKSAQQQQAAAAQETQGAKWQFFPTPSIGAENGPKTSPNADSKVRFIRLQQPLWTGGRLSAQVEQAENREETAAIELKEKQYALAQRWLELWAEANASKQRVLAYTDSLMQHSDYVRKVRARAVEGQIAANEVQLSLTRMASVKAERELAQIQHQQAMSKLAQLWGKDWPAEVAFQLPQEIKPAALELAALQQMSLDTHPSLLKSQMLIKNANVDVKLAKARLQPEVYVRAEISHGNVSGENKRMFIGFNSSLGGGLSNFSSISSAQSRVLALEEDVQVKRNELFDLIAADYFQNIGQTQRSIQLQEALDAAQAYLASSEVQFQAGRRGWQELMNSAREKAQLSAQLADTQAQTWLTQERLRLNSQGLVNFLATVSP